MSEVQDIGGGWKAMEVPGRGVIVQAEMGLIFVDDVCIQDGAIVCNYSDSPIPEVSVPLKKPGPSSIASVNVKAFLAETEKRNLRADGEYGARGVYLAKLRDVLKGVEPNSEVESALGSLLATGNHERYGSAAAIYAMEQKQLDELVDALASPLPVVLQEFVDRAIVGAA